MVAEPSRASAAAMSSEFEEHVVILLGRSMPEHSTTGRGYGTSRTLPDVTDHMVIVTQVAPYADGPAGVHGVLGQAATGLSELAGLGGLSPTVVTDVARHLARPAGGHASSPSSPSARPRGPHRRRPPWQRAWRQGDLRILGVHSATDANHQWPAYGDMIGARFDGHPWTQDFTIDVVDPDHPSTAHLGRQWHWHDEVYLFTDLRPHARVLLRLADDQVDLSQPGGRVPDVRFPSGLERARTAQPGPSTARWATSRGRGRPRPTCAIWPGASPG